MQSALISSKNKETGREKAKEIFKSLKIDKFDITILEFEKAVGIPDVREIQQKIYFKPLRGEFRAVLIDATLGITIEAQNALLKTLEETPKSTLIIVQVLNSDEILPTILSRCKIYEIISQKEHIDTSKFIKILNSSNGVGERLKLAQDLSKDSPAGRQVKDEALDFLESLIIDLRKDLVSNYKKIKSIQKIFTIIKTTNVNLRLTLENLFLNL